MCSNELKKLEETYKGLPKVPDFGELYVASEKGIYEYRALKGKFKSMCIMDIPEISIAKSTLESGSQVEFHTHKNKYEMLIILSGSMKISFSDGSEKNLLKNDYLAIDGGIAHRADVNEDTTFIAISVPKDEGFPGK